LSICRGLPIIVLLLASFTSLAQPPDPGQGVFLAIVIDDLGNSRLEGERVAALPGPVACSVLPQTPFSVHLAERCQSAGKEILLHLPMQPDDPAADPGPGALMTGQSRATLQSLLHAGIDHLPGVIGVNNHMGSYLTRHAAYMDWLMEDLSQMHGTLFVDSMTTPHSKALGIARAYGVATTRRDLFIDNDPSPEGVRAQWRLLLESALREGSALAIGHPRDATLDLLETELEGLEARGIILTSVTDLIRFRQRETTRWQEFSSR
jgi:polysaccharide deacetylase 2 family uncharacterized protein YibQ